jgi:mannobiose 2-epimerase
MDKENQLALEARKELTEHIIPFWMGLRDDGYGGYYGMLDYSLKLDKKAVKGCILNSRILWFFSEAYITLHDKKLLNEAEHAFRFMCDCCMDKEQGGIYWSISYDGRPADTTKHTYNQAFAIYALSAYYDASGDSRALEMATGLFRLIESRCADQDGYGEAYDRDFRPASNDKLSENGVMADRTMNTLLHLLEGYTGLMRITHSKDVENRLRMILELFMTKVYNPEKHRLEVFFDRDYRSLIDLHSFGHDIEASWLLDRACEEIEDIGLTQRVRAVTDDLRAQTEKEPFDGHSVPNENECGRIDTTRVWWVQAESVVGFVNGYQKEGRAQYLENAVHIWDYIKEYVIDRRKGSEWYWQVDENGKPAKREIVEPWKCPYHNGRMCMELIYRAGIM